MTLKLRALLVVVALSAAIGVAVLTAPMASCPTRGHGAPTIAGTINLVFDEDFGSAGIVVGKNPTCDSCKRARSTQLPTD